jgi:hypothetical protein
MKVKLLVLSLISLFCLNTKAQIITTVAGNGTAGYSGDGGQATAAELNGPSGVTVDALGNMYIADLKNNVIRKINTFGIISTIAGTGTAGYSGDGGQATLAKLNQVTDVAFDAAGNMYIDDSHNHCIRKVDPTGIITTVAGTGSSGQSGDGGVATSAQLYYPNRIVLDAYGNLYISDTYNYAVRKVNTSGIITTIAGVLGSFGFTGDGGQATVARLYDPTGLGFDGVGNLYIMDEYNNRIRKLNTAGILSTVAGNGVAGYSGDGGQATTAEMNNPLGLAVDNAGNMYFPERTPNIIRKIDASGIISTIAGSTVTAGYSGDGGLASVAKLNTPVNLSLDINNNLYIADNGNNVIRKISAPCPVSINGVTNICSGNGTVLTASGAASYTWSANAGSVNTNTVSVIPSSSATYTLLSSDVGCASYNIITVSVTTTPTLSISGNTNLCSGANTTLTGNGATSYTWNTGAFSIVTPTVNISPNNNTSFTVSAANGNCITNGVVTVTVTPTPTLGVNGITNICSGTSTILTASGATTYNWGSNAGSVTTNTVSVSPLVNTTYTLTGANGICAVIIPVTVDVTITPTVTISGTNSICFGNNTTLTGSGATTYSWSANANNSATNTVTINPTITDSYTLVGANGNCTNSGIITVTVIPSPIIVTKSDTICSGNLATLNATGASTYTWNPVPEYSNSNGSSIINSPTVTTTYTVAGTATTTCIGSAIVSIVVNDCTTDIKEIVNTSGIAVYPNPTNGNFTIETDGTAHCILFNLNGSEVFNQVITGKTTIDASSLSEGIYTISTINNTSVVNKRLIIIK